MSFSSLRSHFFKHLAYTPTSFTRHIHNIRINSYISLSLSTGLSHPSFTFPRAKSQWRLNSSSATFSASSETPPNGFFSSPYLSVHIRCRKDVVDMLSEALLCFGASSVTIDEQDTYKPDDEVCISSIFSDCEDVNECISHAVDSIGLKEIPTYEVLTGDHSDWIKKTQESFHPVEVTDGFWIVPEWRTPPNTQATNIILNPGLAFGTGEHPTTKLCLLFLHRLIKGDELFLDYGTGSGVLAIAALKLGAALSVGFDIDPQAIRSARQNAALNNIGPEKMQLLVVSSKKSSPVADGTICGDVEGENIYGTGVLYETEKYDVVVANILLNPLLDLADRIVSYAKPGAVVAVSGIILEQLPCIMERYSEFLEGVSVSKMDDWACVSGTKKRNL